MQEDGISARVVVYSIFAALFTIILVASWRKPECMMVGRIFLMFAGFGSAGPLMGGGGRIRNEFLAFS